MKDIFLDLDYTIVDFDIAHHRAIAALSDTYGSDFGAAFELWFRITLEGRRVRGNDWSAVPGGQSAFHKITSSLRAELGNGKHLPWSRQLGAAYVFSALGLPVDRTKAEKIGNTYWEAIAANVVLYPDAQLFLKKVQAQGIRFHIFTGSDSHLQWKEGRWLYDPEYSRQVKTQRILPLEKQGFTPTSITIGDPVDKPSPLFFHAMIKNAALAVGEKVDVSEAITVGDSFEADVRAPLEVLGFQAGYWLRHGQKSTEIDERVKSVGRLTEIPIV